MLQTHYAYYPCFKHIGLATFFLTANNCSCNKKAAAAVFFEMLLNQENVGADPIPTWLPAHPVQKLTKCWFSKTHSAPGSLTVLLSRTYPIQSRDRNLVPMLYITFLYITCMIMFYAVL